MVVGKLTKAQYEILTAMDAGHEMVFSQDGDDAWLWPKHPLGFLPDDAVIDLRKRGFIASKTRDDEEDYARFGPPTVITEAGRAALRTEGEG
jgi:hypothetical protein